jgi:hypothetical protein
MCYNMVQATQVQFPLTLSYFLSTISEMALEVIICILLF